MNNVIVKYKNEDVNNNECYNHIQNECMICSDNNNLILLENNFCCCFKYGVFCETCFISWLLNNHKCIICRKNIQGENESIFDIIHVLNIEIYHKILLKLENIYNNELTNVSGIPRDNRVLIRNLYDNNIEGEYNLTINFKNKFNYYLFKCFLFYTIISGIFNLFYLIYYYPL